MKGWSDGANQHAFMEHVAKVQGYTSFQDWYALRGSDITRLGGNSPLPFSLFFLFPFSILISVYVFEFRLLSLIFAITQGSGLYNVFGNSPSRIVMSIYNSHNWEPWRFKVTPVGFWDDMKNQRIKRGTVQEIGESRREHGKVEEGKERSVQGREIVRG